MHVQLFHSHNGVLQLYRPPAKCEQHTAFIFGHLSPLYFVVTWACVNAALVNAGPQQAPPNNEAPMNEALSAQVKPHRKGCVTHERSSGSWHWGLIDPPSVPEECL